MGRVKIFQPQLQRLLTVFFVALFGITLISQILPLFASAVGSQVTTRSIKLSTSLPSATAVTYTVQFTAQTAETHPDVIVDFCNATSDPIVGDTCSGTAGTDVPNTSSVPSSCATGWTCTAIDSNHGLYLTTSTLSFTALGAVTIPITGVVNMSNVATTGNNNAGNFYGRILDYATGAGSGQTSASPGSYVDYGGVALSTATNINITAKVFETLSFCVFQSSCGTAPFLTLGSPALSATAAYVNSNAEYTVATNASAGINVTMTGTTLCRSATPSNCNTGATSQYTITSIGTTSGFTTAAPSNIGSEQFGMCVDSNSLPSGVSVTAPYLDSSSVKCHGITTGAYAPSTASNFGFDDTTASGGTNNATGSQVLLSTGAISSYTGDLTFLGNVSNLTEAGIYSTNLNLVATGTF